MPKARKLLVDLDTTHTYHCVARCVRRAFLLGDDPLSGRNFDHRKQWVAERIEQLSGIFAAGVCSYGLMSNHLHLVLRIEPEIAHEWEPEDVALRYGSLFRKTVEQARKQPPDVLARRIGVWRERLYSLSWFMRCLCESIARRANHEDDCTGRFWEGRFKSRALLDDAALVTCMAYVDLNPIRAGMATTLEDSEFTSIQTRLLDAARPRQAQCKASWLVPFAGDVASIEPTPESDGGQEQVVAKPAVEPLPLTFGEYAEILRATMEGVRRRPASDELGVAPAEGTVQPAVRSDAARMTLTKLGLSPNGFVDALRHLSERFFTMIGSPRGMAAESKRRKYERRPGLKAAGRLYDASD